MKHALVTAAALVVLVSFPAGGEMDDDDVYDVGDYCQMRGMWHDNDTGAPRGNPACWQEWKCIANGREVWKVFCMWPFKNEDSRDETR